MNFLGFVGRLWNTSNYWLRVTLVVASTILLAVPIPMWFLVAAGNGFGVAILAVSASLAVMVGVVALLAWQPILIGTSGYLARRSLMTLGAAYTVIVISMGLYLSLVNVAADPRLIPYFLLAALLTVGAFFFKGRIRWRIAMVGVLVMSAITVTWMAGGRAHVATGTVQAKRTIAQIFAPMPRGANASQMFTVGRKETAVTLPLMSWFQVLPSQPVYLRLQDNETFLERPDGKLFKVGPTGELVSVGSIGGSIPGDVVYIRAKEKMALVVVTTRFK